MLPAIQTTIERKKKLQAIVYLGFDENALQALSSVIKQESLQRRKRVSAARFISRPSAMPLTVQQQCRIQNPAVRDLSCHLISARPHPQNSVLPPFGLLQLLVSV